LVVHLAIDATDDAHNDVILAAIMKREVALHQRLVGAVLEVVVCAVAAGTVVVEDITQVLIVEVPLGVDDACGTGMPLR
jgi:hypothetical protein